MEMGAQTFTGSLKPLWGLWLSILGRWGTIGRLDQRNDLSWVMYLKVFLLYTIWTVGGQGNNPDKRRWWFGPELQQGRWWEVVRFWIYVDCRASRTSWWIKWQKETSQRWLQGFLAQATRKMELLMNWDDEGFGRSRFGGGR